MRQKKSGRELTAQELIHVEAIERSILWTTDKMLFAYIRVRGQDNSLLDDTDNENYTEALTAALSEQTENYQILSVPRTVDTQGMIRELQALREDTDNAARLQLVSGEIRSLEELADSGAQEPLIFLKIWTAAAPRADEALLDRAAMLTKNLQQNKIDAHIMSDKEILHLCAIFAELGVWQESNIPSDIPVIAGKKRLFSRNPTPEEQAHAALMEQITPAGGLFFNATDLMVGSSFCRCYGVTRYPAEVSYGWAVKLTGATDCVTCITFYPGRAGEIGDALSRAYRDAGRDAREERDLRTRKRYERSAVSADNLIDDLDARGMTLGQMSIVVMPFAESMEALELVCRDVNSRFSAKRMKLKPLSHLQADAFRHLSPYYPNQKAVDALTERIIPLETLIGGYPFTVSTLRDDHGFYFARTAGQGIVSLDIRYRGGDRNNGNCVVTGISGVGKSTMLKAWLQTMVMAGIRCIVIDPEREFRDVCKALGGSWLDTGGGKAKFNLLQIQEPLRDDTEDEDSIFGSEPNALGQHIMLIKSELRLKYPSLSDVQLALIEQSLYGLYAEYGIDNDWAYDPRRSPTEYPIMEQWYHYLQELAKEDARYADLALLLRSMAIGSEAAIWNGHTNIDLDADLVVLDTRQLQNADDAVRTAQYFNLMRMTFSKVSADKHTPYFVMADEAQIMVDPMFPTAAAALRNMALRIRKYEGYLWMAFHSIHELLDDAIRKYGQPILDNACFKVLFGTDGQNLADTIRLYKLTRAEERVLEAEQRGQAVALIGSQHLVLNFDIPAYKLALMGKGGGR